jgi:uncharacterized protein YsxB (DUF464 family)
MEQMVVRIKELVVLSTNIEKMVPMKEPEVAWKMEQTIVQMKELEVGWKKTVETSQEDQAISNQKRVAI